eukprot:c15408_g1_i1.p1 GENE.c15408_g1_i1~~c15408_g1_i1.p1  ORF type:complete len:712 (-),score=270.94 c15408_g1_i1:87-2222(-)
MFFFHFRLLYNAMRFRTKWKCWVYLWMTVIYSLINVYLLDDVIRLTVEIGGVDLIKPKVPKPLDDIYPLFTRATSVALWFMAFLYSTYLISNVYFWVTLSVIREKQMLDDELRAEREALSCTDRVYYYFKGLYEKITKKYSYREIPTESGAESRPEGGWKCSFERHKELLLPGSILVSPNFLQFCSEHFVFSRRISRVWKIREVQNIVQRGRIVEIQDVKGNFRVFFETEELCSKFTNEVWEVWISYFEDVTDMSTLICHPSQKFRHFTQNIPPAIESQDIDTSPIIPKKRGMIKQDSHVSLVSFSETDEENSKPFLVTSGMDPFSDIEWEWIVDGLSVEPYHADDVIIEIGQSITSLFCSHSKVKIELDDESIIREIESTKPFGISQFILAMIDENFCKTYLEVAEDENITESNRTSRSFSSSLAGGGISAAIAGRRAPSISHLSSGSFQGVKDDSNRDLRFKTGFEQEKAFILNDHDCVYSIRFSHLISKMQQSASFAAKVYLWVCQFLVDRSFQETLFLCERAENSCKQREKSFSAPLTRLLDGSPLENQESLNYSSKKEEENAVASIFELPFGEPLVLQIECSATKLTSGAHRWSHESGRGTLYVFLHHIGFNSEKTFGITPICFIVPISTIISMDTSTEPDMCILIKTRSDQRAKIFGFDDKALIASIEYLWKEPTVIETKVTKEVHKAFLTSKKTKNNLKQFNII